MRETEGLEMTRDYVLFSAFVLGALVSGILFVMGGGQ